MSFNMVALSAIILNAKTVRTSRNIIGPLVDDGASYSEIGMDELNLLQDHMGVPENIEFDTVTDY